MRARREAAGRPITITEMVAFASAVALLGACFGATSTWFHSPLAAAIIALFLVIPAAVYLVVGRD